MNLLVFSIVTTEQAKKQSELQGSSCHGIREKWVVSLLFSTILDREIKVETLITYFQDWNWKPMLVFDLSVGPPVISMMGGKRDHLRRINLVSSTGLIMWICNRKVRISLLWPIHIINPVDKIKLSCNTPYWCSTTVSLETLFFVYLFFILGTKMQ